MLGKRAIIGAFPWRYEGLEGCPCRIVAFLDVGENVEAIGNAAKAILASMRPSMPKIAASDGTKLYVEESGTGTPVVFVHEYAADYRTWEPQMRHFSRSHRCVTYSQRGYPPSDVPEDPDKYTQACFSR